jgi:hypothetical protein
MHDVLTRPVGHDRDVQPPPPASPVFAYALAAALGGAATGLVLGGIGWLLSEVAGRDAQLFVAAPIVALAVVQQLRGQLAPLPQRRKQVPVRWMQWHSRTRTAGAFGLMIGAGVFTNLRHAAAWVVACLVFTLGSPVLGALVGAGYGFGRAIPLIWTWACDRRGGRRPAWDLLWSPRSALSVGLAPVAAAAFVLVFIQL